MPKKNDTNLELTPTLFVGLGGTGKMVLSELKRLFIEHPFFEKEVPGMIEFLSQDSDADVDIYQDEEEALKALGKDDSILVSAQVSDIKSFLSRKPHIKDWFPISQTKNVELSGRGAKQKRYLGRLAYFSSIDNIIENIRNKLKAISSRSHLVTSDKVRMADTQNANVFIINSLCGGTGSGMFIDIAYTLRELAFTTISKKLAITGMFLTSEAFNLPGFYENIQRNCASALMELDYFMSPNHKDFSVRYTDNFAIQNTISKKPYDFAYLINGTDISDHLLVEKTIAHGIFSKVITNAGKHEDSVKDNIVYDAIEKNENKYTSFSTYGFGSLFFPREEIKEIFSLHFASQMIGNITQKWDKSNKTLKQRYNSFISRNFPEFSLDSNNQQLISKVITDEEIFSISPRISPEDIVALSKEDRSSSIQNWLGKQKLNSIEDKRINEQIESNLKKYSDNLFSVLNKEINEQIVNYDQGVAFSINFIQNFRNELGDMICAWEQEIEMMGNSIKMCSAHINNAFSRIKEISNQFFSFFSKDELKESWDALKMQNKKLTNTTWDKSRLENMVSFMVKISADIDRTYLQVLKIFHTNLEEMRIKTLPKEGKQILNKIYSQKKKNYFVDRLIVDEEDVDINKSWYYDYILYGSSELPDEDLAELWDKYEDDFLKKIEIGSNWRSFATNSFEFENLLKNFSNEMFKSMDTKTIEDFMQEKGSYKYGGDKAKVRAFYLEYLESMYTASKPTTQITDKRGGISPIFTATLGVPDAESMIFTKDLLNNAFPVKNSRVNIASIGFPQRLILLQTVEAIPITAINTVETWAQVYKTSDRYLHSIGEELGVHWHNHLLVRDKVSVNIKMATFYYFLGLYTNVIRKRTKKTMEQTLFYIFEEEDNDIFSPSSKGTNLGDSVEQAIKGLCEKADKLLTLEHEVKTSEAFREMTAEKIAEVL
ncbi:tubulin-like doman-containing protein, partial [bacterium]|nr:tubulin-like doman-containing protein [bacterium]